jgi:Tfp pilus assembly protein PilX
MKNHLSPLRSERGGLLITAMIFSAIIGVSIVSFIRLGRTTGQISNRGLYNNAAMNLAENGLEEAMYSINQMVAGNASAWSAWTTSGTGAQRKWTGTTFDQNATGQVRVFVDNYTGIVAPTLYARSTVTMGAGGGADIEKWIMVQLAKTSKFANGLVAKRNISFSGNNARVDSWNSDPDNNPATPAVAYPTDPNPGTSWNEDANDNGSIGSVAVVAAISVQNADIWGYAATGGAAPSVGSQGLVGPYGTSVGSMNPDHVSSDFTASFDPVTAPTATYTILGNINNALTLPRVGDTPAADGKYYYDFTSISNSGNGNNVTITGGQKVVMRSTFTGTAISFTGQSGLNIGTNASLEIYAEGTIDIAGNGIMNGGTTTATANQPINCQIWGTKTSGTQSISVSGNGVLSAVIYAPQGDVSINGNGDVAGSVVADIIRVTGNAKFHYDESLANFGGGNPYRVALWTELTNAAARTTASSLLSF